MPSASPSGDDDARTATAAAAATTALSCLGCGRGKCSCYSNPPTSLTRSAQHLNSPPTLSRLPLLRQRDTKERSSLQSTLSLRASDQVDSVRDGLARLRDARAAQERIRERLRELEQHVHDPRARVEGFGRLLEVALVHRRVGATLETVAALANTRARLAHIDKLLAVEREHIGTSPNLLAIHYHLSELETFRNETLALSARQKGVAGDDDAGRTRRLDKYFAHLGDTLAAFDAHYFNIAHQLVPLARAGHAAVAVKVAKIAELEGARDEKAVAIKLARKATNADVAARFKSIHADARAIKHYRSRVVDAVKESCKHAIEDSYSRHGDDGALEWIEELEDWLFDDLVTVERDLAHCFPPDWHIFDQFAKAYHTALHDFLAVFVKSDPAPASLLRLAQFVKEYKQNMTKELDVPEKLLQPPLLDGNEQDLVEQYLQLLVRKMDEWTQNLMRTEVEEFTKRENAPEIDADEHYGLQGAVIMFQMLNQQIDAALDSNQGSVLARVVEDANRVMRSCQKQWSDLLDSELRRQIDRPDESPGGLVEYTMALANDQLKSADFTETLLMRLEPLVSNKYKQPIADKLNDAMDGYLDVAKKSVQVLIDVVFNDLKPATKVLLQPAWYTEDPMVQIVETVKDYMADFQTHLNPNLFELLVEDIIDTFLITYLVAVRKSPKLRMPLASERMRKDLSAAFDCFVQYKAPEELEGYFDVLESVLTLVNASKMMVFLDFWPFRKKYGPNLQFVEGIMKARDDLDKSSVNEIMESVRRKVSTDNTGQNEPEEPSIFTRLVRG